MSTHRTQGFFAKKTPRAWASVRLTLLFVAGSALASCANSQASSASRPQGEVQPTNTEDLASTETPRFVVELEPGPYNRGSAGWFIFRYTVRPQVAVWVEKPDGTFIDTIYVTEKGERKNWISAPKTGRPEALPVWNHIKRAGADAVSAATPKGATLRSSELASRLPAGTYVIKLETNRSYDYNERFTKANSGVSGQPSVVYRAEIATGGARTEARFVPFGTGSVDGSEGEIHPGLDGITTALGLFSTMKVVYKAE